MCTTRRGVTTLSWVICPMQMSCFLSIIKALRMSQLANVGIFCQRKGVRGLKKPLTILKFVCYFVFQSTFYMLRFNRVYFFLTLLILAIEIGIARFLHDPIIRPYGGDYL